MLSELHHTMDHGGDLMADEQGPETQAEQEETPRRLYRVVHLDDEHHTRAKDYADRHGKTLKELVQELIDERLAKVEKGKPIMTFAGPLGGDDDDAPPWAQPPFWSKP